MQATPVPVPAAQRWTPWALGAVVAVAYVAIGPRGAASDAPVWSVLARVAALIPIGDGADRAQLLGAACAGGAAILIARLVIALAGEGPAALAGAAAGAAVMAGAGPWAHAAAGPIALIAALALAAITLTDRIAAGGGAWPGVSAGVAVGLAIAMDRGALGLVPVMLGLLVIRMKHGARWPLYAPLAGGVAWALAMIPVWRGGGAVIAGGVGDARYALDLADAVGAIAVVAAAAGVVVLWARRRTRWSGALIAALIAGAIAIDRIGGHGVGGLPVVGLAVCAGVGVARLARLAGAPVGQACVGAAAAVIVALPAALSAL